MKRKRWHTRLAAVALVLLAAGTVSAIDGVGGAVVIPNLVEAKVRGCKIARPGDVKARAGDLIQLDYVFAGGTAPKKVDYKLTNNGVIMKSSLGVALTKDHGAKPVGVAFFFNTVKPGKEKVILIIDNVNYEYDFTITN
jgi:hypothetical protein